MRKHLFLLIVAVVSLLNTSVKAQELKAKVTVMAGRVATTVDRKIFTTLQTQLNNFMNNRKWTADVFRENEKILITFPKLVLYKISFWSLASFNNSGYFLINFLIKLGI